MKKNEINFILIIFFILIVSVIIIIFFTNNSITVEIDLKILNITDFTLNYSYISKSNILQDKITLFVEHLDNYKTIKFKLPGKIHDLKEFNFIFPRKYNLIDIKEIRLKGFLKELTWYSNSIEIGKSDYNNFYSSKQDNIFHIVNIKSEINITVNKVEFDKIKYINYSYKSHARSILFFLILLVLFLFFYFLKNFIMIFNHNKKDKKDILISMVFILIIFLPIIGNIFKLNENTADIEKRTHTAKPDFNLMDLLDYPKKFSEYFDDNFVFRNNFINLYNFIILKMLHESPVPDLVVIGKKEWLFLNSEQCMEDYMGKIQYSQNELKEILINLQNKKAWLEKHGIKYYIFITPDKQTIYPEFLPDNIKKIKSKKKLDQIISYLKENSDIEIIDVRDLFLNEKKRNVLFYKIDSHWNYYGSLIATSEAVRNIKKDFSDKINHILDINDFNIRVLKINDPNLNAEEKNLTSSVGDLMKLMVSDKFKFNDDFFYFIPKKEFKFEFVAQNVYKNPSTPERPLFITENKSGCQLKAVVFRDSYFSINFFSEYFKRCVYIWPNLAIKESFFNPEIILKEKPDIVLEESCERLSYVITSYDINQFKDK